MTDALQHLTSQANMPELLRVAIAGGGQSDREIAAAWLGRHSGQDIDPGRVVVTNGTQTALRLVTSHLVEAGRAVATEALMWGSLPRLAAHAGVRLVPVDLDEEGMVPEALANACRRETPALIYCNPTHHNPTTATMSAKRRSEIADIARAYGVPIFEDDTVGALHDDAPPSIASLAPDITWYSMGLTKCLAQGLRVGYLVAPSTEAADALRSSLSGLSHWVAQPIAAHIVSHWISTGHADTITAAIHTESVARQQIATQTLTDFTFRAPEGGLHLWLRVPDGITARDFTRAADAAGVLITPADLFAIDGSKSPEFVRLSLGPPPERADLLLGLQRLVQVSGSLHRGDSHELETRR